MANLLKVLVVEDSEDDALLEVRHIERAGYRVKHLRVETAAALEKALEAGGWDVVMCDFTMPVFSGADALRLVRAKDPFIPFIFVSGTIAEETAVKALKDGANDYILKSDLRRLVSSIERELNERDLQLQRIKTLEALREGEEKFRDLFESAPVGYHEIDSEGLITRVNTAELESFGYTLKEMLGKPAWIFASDPEAARVRVEEKLSEKAPVSVNAERVYVRKDGSTFPAVIQERYIRDAHGKVTGIRTVVQDITTRKQAEAALEAERSLLRTLIDTLPDYIYVKHADGRFAAANRAVARQLGLVSPDELTGKTDFDLFPRELADRYLEDEQIIMKTGIGLFNHEGPTIDRSKQPNERWISTSKVPLRDASGMITGYVGLGRDITEMKELFRETEQQAALLDQTHDAISVIDLQKGVVFWNRGAEELYGWKCAEVTAGSRRWYPLAEEGSEPAFRHGQAGDSRPGTGFIDDSHRAAFEATLSAGSWKGELRERTRAGKNIVVLSEWTLLKDEHGGPGSILFISTDITEQKALEEQSRKIQRLDMLSTLAGGIAHDLNNIFTPMELTVEILRRKYGADKKTAHLLDTLEASIFRGSGVVKQILGMAGATEGHREIISPAAVVDDIALIVTETFPKNISVERIVAPGTGSFLADRTQVRQILLNLSIMARNSMPGGGRLTFSARNTSIDGQYAGMIPDARAGEFVELDVSDTGRGMHKDDIPKLFDPLLAAKDFGEIGGPGLASALRLVRAHEGFMLTESEPFQGTTFRVFLPAAKPGECDACREPEPKLRLGQGETVLVVDDEQPVREITKTTLEAYGYSVLLACDGSEAVSIYAKRRGEIALVITDLAMPVMDGTATVKALRTINPSVRIIVATGFLENEGDNPITASVSATLKKPFTSKTLMLKVSEVLSPADILL